MKTKRRNYKLELTEYPINMYYTWDGEGHGEGGGGWWRRIDYDAPTNSTHQHMP